MADKRINKLPNDLRGMICEVESAVKLYCLRVTELLEEAVQQMHDGVISAEQAQLVVDVSSDSTERIVNEFMSKVDAIFTEREGQ